MAEPNRSFKVPGLCSCPKKGERGISNSWTSAFESVKLRLRYRAAHRSGHEARRRKRADCNRISASSTRPIQGCSRLTSARDARSSFTTEAPHLAATTFCPFDQNAVEALMAKEKKMSGSSEHVAGVLIRSSIRATRREFAAMVEQALQANTREEVAAIAAHMPSELKELLPRKYLH
jgi:hypothetical protein